jgi:Ca2+-binding RTX toxin-like protein
MVRLAVLTVLLALAAPAVARAADVSVTNGILRYTATPGKVSNVAFVESAPGTVQINVGAEDTEALNPLAGCAAGTPVVCTGDTGVTSVAADAGDMSDRITATSGTSGLVNIPAAINGGDGNDALDGGARGDTLDGGAGDDVINGFAGNDTIRGGDGNDTITPNTGSDSVSGGADVDTVVYGFRAAPTFTLDGLANDGEAGENDLLGADVENVTASASSGVATIAGDGRANVLTVTDGRGDLTGGDGADILEGGPLDDSFHARDGAPDTIVCNGGMDTVEADTQDTISPTCELVSVVATPGGVFDDRPPAIAWNLPGADASLSANTPSKLSATASDDRGIAKVAFYDDDRLLCEVAAAPFDCAYAPRGGDVGRNTLIAVAVDGAGQTTSIVRAVTVRRFTTPKFTMASVRPSRDRKAPYSFHAKGEVTRPTAVSPSQGCSGTVTISAKRGTKTVATQRTILHRTCEFETTVRFRSKLASKLRLIAKFSGNDVLTERTAPSRTVRLG